MDGLVLDLSGFADAPLALDAEGDPAVGHPGVVVLGAEVDYPAASLLESPVSLVRTAMLGGAHLRVLPVEPGQVAQQCAAVVLDRGHHVVRGALFDQVPGGVVLGVQRVEGHDAPGEVEPGEQGANGRDLVVLVLDRLLSEHDSGAMFGGSHEQMLRAGVVPGGAADGLAVDGHGLVGRCVLRGPGTRGAVERVGVKRGEDLDERGCRRSGEAPQAMAVERPQGAKLALGQSLGRTRRSRWRRGSRRASRPPRWSGAWQADSAARARRGTPARREDTRTGFEAESRSTVGGRLRFASAARRRGAEAVRARRGPMR